MKTLLLVLIELCLCQLESSLYQGFMFESKGFYLNSTGVVTISPTYQDVSGILYMASNQQELDTLLNTMNGMFTLILNYWLLTEDTWNRIIQSNKVTSVYFFQQNRPTQFNAETNMPLMKQSLYQNDGNPHVWNPQGNALVELKFPLPVGLVNRSDIYQNQSLQIFLEANSINNQKQYQNFPLFSTETRHQFTAAVNSLVCLRRGRCGMVGDYSVFAAFSNITIEDGKPIIIVSSATDAKALFAGKSVGATVSSSMAVLFAIADALGKSIPQSTFSKHILFTLFGAEQEGLLGSRRFVNDISKPFQCKNHDSNSACLFASGNACQIPCRRQTDFTRIQFNKIEAIFEISHLGGFGSNLANNNAANPSSVFLHYDQDSAANEQLNNLLTQSGQVTMPIGNRTFYVNFAKADSAAKLPPGSSHSFLKVNRTIPAVIIGDYNAEFTSPFYHSEWDDFSQVSDLNIGYMCAAATRTARAIWSLSQSSAAPSTLQANCSMIKELMECLTFNATCSFLQPFTSPLKGIDLRKQASTFSPGTLDLKQYWLSRLMLNLTSNKKTFSNCSNDKDCGSVQNDGDVADWDKPMCISGSCVTGFIGMHEAYDVGVEWNPVKSRFDIVDPTQELLTISTVDHVQARVYLASSSVYDGLVLGLGLLLIGVGAVGTFYGRRWIYGKFKKD